MSGGNPARRALSEDDIRKLLRDAVKDTVTVNHVCSCGKYHKVRVLDKQRLAKALKIAMEYGYGKPAPEKPTADTTLSGRVDLYSLNKTDLQKIQTQIGVFIANAERAKTRQPKKPTETGERTEA